MAPSVGGQGSNSANLRAFHERVILTALRRLGQASKADLARHARFTDNTAGVIVRTLVERRLVRAEGKRMGGRGQPATLLSLDPRGAHAIGIKIGRRSIDGVLVDFCGEVLHHRRLEQSFPMPEEALRLALGLVAELRCQVPGRDGGTLAGLGLAMPYDLANWQRELAVPTAAYQRWRGFDLGTRLGAATGLPVFVENDGTAAAVAELFRGHGRDIDNFLYVFLGTAIGGGIVLGGDFVRGPSGNAGDIGLMPTGPARLASAPRPARSHDVLLNRASISSLARHLAAGGEATTTRTELDAAIAARPDLVAEWLDDCIDALVAPLLSAARVLDLEVVVLDGDLPKPLLDTAVARLHDALEYAAPEARAAPMLRHGRIGRAAAAIGAAILPLHLSFGPSPEILLGAEPLPEPMALSA